MGILLLMFQIVNKCFPKDLSAVLFAGLHLCALDAFEVQACILFSLNKQSLLCFLRYVKLCLSLIHGVLQKMKLEVLLIVCQDISSQPEQEK